MFEFCMGILGGVLISAVFIVIYKVLFTFISENEIYMEGFADGQKSNLECEIIAIKAEADYCRRLAQENYDAHMAITAYKLDAKAEAFETCIDMLKKSCEERI